MVYPHIFLLTSSLVGHDAETKYVGRECADKVHILDPAGEFPANIFEPGKISEKVSSANNNNKKSGNKRTTD